MIEIENGDDALLDRINRRCDALIARMNKDAITILAAIFEARRRSKMTGAEATARDVKLAWSRMTERAALPPEHR